MRNMEQASTPDVIERARRELERAQDADDASRLATLEELHEVLEEEVDKASPSGR
jgi:hypothetical protein